MSLHLTATPNAGPDSPGSDARVLRPTSAPTVETLFDVIQVCEISLGVVSRHQFDAWVRGPLNSLISHRGFIVWPLCGDNVRGVPALLGVETERFPLAAMSDLHIARLGLELRRQWISADRTPLSLDAVAAVADFLPRAADDTQILVHGADPVGSGTGTLFALICDAVRENSNVLFMIQLIAPYLQLAVQRLDPAAETSGWISTEVSRPRPAATGLTSREIGILECIRDGKTNAQIGAALNISPFTVKSHLQRMFRKLDVSTRTQAVALALSLKILDHGRQRAVSAKA